MMQENPHLPRVQRILQKLKEARARPRQSKHDDFRLKPPLSETELLEFETTHNIRLPEDYRTFLAHAGNGGAGPYYGVYRLDEWEEFADWVIDERPDNFVSLPCPMHPGMSLADDWDKQFGDASPYQGTITIGSQGCTYITQLIVTGPFAGRVVYIHADHRPPYMVHEPDFLSWYERWLDELLQGYTMSEFGYGPGGGEDDFFRILDDPQANDEFKAEAMRAFCRLPKISDTGAERIGGFLDHPFEEMRLGALSTVMTHHLSGYFERVMQLLDDTSPKVRERALRTTMKLDVPRSIEAALRLLREDTNNDVSRTAFSLLKADGALPQTELMRLFNESPPSHLHEMAASEIAEVTDDVALLCRMLTDEEGRLRGFALRGLKRLKARQVLPQLLELLECEKRPVIIDMILEILGDFQDSTASPILLQWTANTDDFHRLKSVQALVKIGDERVAPMARVMLQENRYARRGLPGESGQAMSGQAISKLIRQSLQESPNPVLRELA